MADFAFKSPWGYKNYDVGPEQHAKNLKVRIGQLSRDLTDFNKRYPGEAHPGREQLRNYRKELKGLKDA